MHTQTSAPKINPLGQSCRAVIYDRPEVVFMLMSRGGWAYIAGSALHSAHGLRSFSFAPLSQFYYDLQTALGEYIRCGAACWRGLLGPGGGV